MGEEHGQRRRFARVDRELRNDGYESRAPSAEVAAQDEATCQRLTCDQCRRPGLKYRPYVLPSARAAGSGYRALAVCARCDVAIEF